MSKHSFQLTYSVYLLHENEESKESADKARYLIRNIKGWEMLDKIETTLVGELFLDSLHISKKEKMQKTLWIQLFVMYYTTMVSFMM